MQSVTSLLKAFTSTGKSIFSSVFLSHISGFFPRLFSLSLSLSLSGISEIVLFLFTRLFIVMSSSGNNCPITSSLLSSSVTESLVSLPLVPSPSADPSPLVLALPLYYSFQLILSRVLQLNLEVFQRFLSG